MTRPGGLKPKVRRLRPGYWTVAWPSRYSGGYLIGTCDSWDQAIEAALTLQPGPAWTQR